MKTYSSLAAFSLIILATSGTVPAMAGTSTHDFIENATIGGTFEVESSRVALQNSQNDGIKDFAQEMVDDHTQANEQLKQTVSSENPENAQPTIALDSQHQKMLDKLNKKTGPDFDKLYMDDQLKAHKEAVKLFSDYAKNGNDAGLKQFAAQTLPILQKHKQDIVQLQKNYTTGQ